MASKTNSKPSKRPLKSYLDSERELVVRTIRATPKVWERMQKLADRHDISVNSAVVAALEKVCDEEGV